MKIKIINLICIICDIIITSDNIRGSFKFPCCNNCFDKKFDGNIFKYMEYINKIKIGN